MELRLHAFEPASRANGPGVRAVVWVQGCTLGCRNCFNPLTHDITLGTVCDTAELAARILDLGESISGVSISGGEPFQQPAALLDLLERLSKQPLSRLVFSGYSLAEIRSQELGPVILEQIDVLIAGRFVTSRPVGHSLLGSANQEIHLLTKRHSLGEISGVPKREVILHADGSLTSTGISPIFTRTTTDSDESD